jgi:hypothetical protein
VRVLIRLMATRRYGGLEGRCRHGDIEMWRVTAGVVTWRHGGPEVLKGSLPEFVDGVARLPHGVELHGHRRGCRREGSSRERQR